MTDGRSRTPRIPDYDVAPRLEESQREAGAKSSRRRRGVAGGRIAAAGIGIATMLGLAANMQVASGRTSAEPPADAGPAPRLDVLRFEKAVHLGPATQPRRIADAGKTAPIVLTPRAVVHTVGGGSSGGSGGSYSGAAYAAPAAAAPAPVASTSGSR